MATSVKKFDLALAMKSKFWPEFAQGARCGHCEAIGRTGQYVHGEEQIPASEAALVNIPNSDATRQLVWETGYCHGYLLRCDGEPLCREILEAPLPND
jgi:hypothetical protein